MFNNALPYNLLDAINLCLQSMGEPPVNTTDVSELPPDAINALDFIQRSSRDVQASGWNFNTERMKFTPNADGEIILPINVAKVDSVGRSKATDVVQRGQKLYDKGNHTFIFKEPIELEIVFILDFEDCPLSFRNYAALNAAANFQQSILGAPEIDAVIQRRMQMAWVQLRRDEINSSDANVLRDNVSTASIMFRRRGGII